MPMITIRLVGGTIDELFERIQIDPQIKMKDLTEKIANITKIPIKYQEIEFRGESLPDTYQPLISIEQFEELVVKHAFLDKWKGFQETYKQIDDMNEAEAARTKLAHHAIKISKVLVESHFFNAYPSFYRDWIEMNSDFTRLDTQNSLEQSATSFFSKMYPDAKIDFKPKESGTRAGIVVAVTCHDEVTTYYMKTYHHAGAGFSIPPYKTEKIHLSDLREMFVYRLLELLGVGPIVFFPLYFASTNIPFIATREVKEFKKMNQINDASLRNKVVVEAYLLYLILGIRDLHEENFGSTKNQAFFIIDFYVPDTDNFERRRIVEDFKDKSNIDMLGEVSEILTEIGHEERIRIAKDTLPRWSQINSITSDIIGGEMSELQRHGMKFVPDTTDVESYLQDIKTNYASICSAFN